MPAKSAYVLEVPKSYDFLKKVRESKTVSLKSTSMLRSEIIGLDGNPQPLRVRYYQVQAIMHLLTMKRMVLGDATGVGKTLCAIATLCYMWEKEPDNKVMVVTPKSALRQWAGEIEKFTTGITPYIVDGTPNQRKQTYLEFALHKGPSKAVLLVGYAPLKRDWTKLTADGGQEIGTLSHITGLIKDLTVVFDEAAAFKNDRSKTWDVCSALSAKATRCYGLTATLLKNNLIEGFCIYKVVYPQVFSTKTAFHRDYCVTQLQRVAGGRKIPIIVGYKNLGKFREVIDPYFLGRPKHAISDELPKLITREVLVELTPAEDAKYGEALTGILELGDGEIKEYEENKTLVSLIYCQKTVDSMSLLRYGEGDVVNLDIFDEAGAEVSAVSSKEQALLDLLTEEFDDEKVIVYCRFASLIPRLQELCKKQGIENVAVTGNVVDTDKNPARSMAQKAFQDLNSKIKVIFISDAGSEAINLQAASAMVFYNAPWSWGNYVQLLGRPIRIGSPHEKVIAIHLVTERPRVGIKDRKTIDRYTLEILQKKKTLIDSVLGEAAVGALDFKGESSFAHQLQNSLSAGVTRPSGSKIK
jgi:SNF2 family DNA or RNA helicase